MYLHAFRLHTRRMFYSVLSPCVGMAGSPHQPSPLDSERMVAYGPDGLSSAVWQQILAAWGYPDVDTARHRYDSIFNNREASLSIPALALRMARSPGGLSYTAWEEIAAVWGSLDPEGVRDLYQLIQRCSEQHLESMERQQLWSCRVLVNWKRLYLLLCRLF